MAGDRPWLLQRLYSRPLAEQSSPEWIAMEREMAMTIVRLTDVEVREWVTRSAHMAVARAAARTAYEPMRRLTEEAETNPGLRIVLGLDEPGRGES